nr:ion transporter [Lachnospiraceae bacterium]
ILYNKRQQLISSMFIIVVLMLASSLCMYSAEHLAQPEVFRNALSGLWWAGSTLLTVGYGDIYPITPAGQLMGTMIAFLGVGVVAIPTGIMSAGFIEQYNEVKEMEAKKHVDQYDPDEQILSVSIAAGDVWSEKAVGEISLPRCMSIEKIMRRGVTITAEHDIEIEAGDILFIRVEK